MRARGRLTADTFNHCVFYFVCTTESLRNNRKFNTDHHGRYGIGPAYSALLLLRNAQGAVRGNENRNPRRAQKAELRLSQKIPRVQTTLNVNLQGIWVVAPGEKKSRPLRGRV